MDPRSASRPGSAGSEAVGLAETSDGPAGGWQSRHSRIPAHTGATDANATQSANRAAAKARPLFSDLTAALPIRSPFLARPSSRIPDTPRLGAQTRPAGHRQTSPVESLRNATAADTTGSYRDGKPFRLSKSCGLRGICGTKRLYGISGKNTETAKAGVTQVGRRWPRTRDTAGGLCGRSGLAQLTRNGPGLGPPARAPRDSQRTAACPTRTA